MVKTRLKQIWKKTPDDPVYKDREKAHIYQLTFNSSSVSVPSSFSIFPLSHKALKTTELISCKNDKSYLIRNFNVQSVFFTFILICYIDNKTGCIEMRIFDKYMDFLYKWIRP